MDYKALKDNNRKLVMQDWNDGNPVPRGNPLRFTLNTSHNCNLRCVMCQFHRTPEVSKRVVKRQPRFSKSVYGNFLDQIFPTLIEAETTTVGEPFLSRYFDITLQKAIQYEVDLYVTTNGTLLDQKNIDKIFDRLSTLVISIDGAIKETYEAIRIRGDFDLLLDNIYRFIETREQNENQPGLTLQMTLLQKNVTDLPKMVELANELGADTVKAYHAYIYDDEMVDQSLFYHQSLFNKNLEKAHTLAKMYGITTSFPQPFSSDLIQLKNTENMKFSKPPCRFLWTEGFLEPTGELTACFFPYKYVVGDINTHDFGDIWRNDIYQELRNKVGNPIPHNYCGNCELRMTYLDDYQGSGVDEEQFILTNDHRLDFFR